MSHTRRAILSRMGARRSPLRNQPTAPWIAARGYEALAAERWPEPLEATMVPPPVEGEIRLSSNENPVGPGARAVSAMRLGFDDASRYPDNARPSMAELQALLAAVNGAEADNVVLGAGSGELLQNASQAFTSADRHLVTATPSYLNPVRVAEYLGARVVSVRVDTDGRLDLKAMAATVDGAGLVFLCNPNNPTGTACPASAVVEFITTVGERSPETVILIDEAYHDYASGPLYSTAIPLALETPNVFVTRTFSKAYGMAGMRVGYAIGHPAVIARLARFGMEVGQNSIAVSAAYVMIQDPGQIKREHERNHAARRFTVDFFAGAGYPAFESQTNFIFVDIGRPASEFRDACAKHGVVVGRDFPPMEQTHARISIGTIEEMKQATVVFREVLR